MTPHLHHVMSDRIMRVLRGKSEWGTINEYLIMFFVTLMKTCLSHLMIFFSLFLVPKLEGKDKPVITYERDKAVMVCKTEYDPKGWTWYMTNGTERVRSPSVGQAKHCDK